MLRGVHHQQITKGLLRLVAWNDSIGLSLTIYKHVEHHVPGTCFTPSQYDKFLFATIGEEKNETPLSVLSTLARLEKDPWQEAARLTELPKHQAAQGISTLLAALPGGPWTASECNSVAARLVELLPQRNNGSVPAGERIGSQLALCLALMWLIFAAFWGIVVFESQPRTSAGQGGNVQISKAVPSPQQPSPYAN